MSSTILSNVTNQYVTTFTGYVHLFTTWGQWLFYTLFTVNLLWMFLWYAFERGDMISAMADFLKRFFIIMLFYTFMIHPEWMGSILSTVGVMGQQLTNMTSLDPSNIVNQGAAIANKIIQPMQDMGLLHDLLPILIGFASCAIIIFVFISIAIELSVTLIIATLMISISTFFFGFAGLNATSHIARQSLDVLLGYCIKLLGIYIVVGTGSQTISNIAGTIPTTFQSFDPYVELLAAACLFWLLAKTLPGELGRIVAHGIKDTHGVDSAAIAGTAASTAQLIAAPAAAMASKVAGQVAKMGGSTAANAAAHAIKMRSQGGPMQAAKGFASDVGNAIKDSAKAQLGHMASTLSGGQAKSPQGYTERMHSASYSLMFPEKSNTNKSTKATFSKPKG